MNIKFTWRNATKSEAIENLLSKKLEKLDRHFDKVNQIQVTFESHGKLEHIAKATVHVRGTEVNAHATEEDMYKAVDAMTHKLIRQIEAHKAKANNHHRDHKINEHEEE